MFIGQPFRPTKIPKLSAEPLCLTILPGVGQRVGFVKLSVKTLNVGNILLLQFSPHRAIYPSLLYSNPK